MCSCAHPLPLAGLQERLVDIIFCNEQEAQALCQVGPASSEQAAARVLTLGGLQLLTPIVRLNIIGSAVVGMPPACLPSWQIRNASLYPVLLCRPQAWHSQLTVTRRLLLPRTTC